MSEQPPRREVEDFIRVVGQGRRPLSELYAMLLRSSWALVILGAFLLFVAINAVFAGLYCLDPSSIHGAEPGSFRDAFFFSVQTFSSIGYGAFYSDSAYGNALVVMEAFSSLIYIAMLTGLIFAKFSRPRAFVLFSRTPVVGKRNGVPCLMFRVANQRGSHIAQAELKVDILKTELTSEGHHLRRFYPLKLERASSPIFVLSWQVIHRIDEDSPIYGMSSEQLIADDVRFIIGLSGFDDTYAQTVHVRHNYWADEVRFGHQLEDVMTHFDDGVVEMDFRKFHDIRPEEPEA